MHIIYLYFVAKKFFFMLDQNYSAINLKKLIGFRDLVNQDIGRNKFEIESHITKISEGINKDDFRISELKTHETSGDTIYQVTTIEDFFALKKLNDNLSRLYKVQQSNRHLIIRQILVLLKETMPITIIKLDIKQFYRSINKEKILEKLNRDSLLSYKSKSILNKLFSSDQLKTESGLPRGLNISASMSELFMRDFDENVRRLHGVYYYARYVDDIIIFCHCNSKEIIQEIEKLLSKKNLSLNYKKQKVLTRLGCQCKQKCKCITSNTLSFEYLGYCFEFSDIAYIPYELKVSLAPKKVNKIKTRIIKAFLDYLSNKNFKLLNHRVALLTGNYVIKSSNRGKLKSGIFYNHPFIDKESTCLKELTLFLRKTINANSGSFGEKIRLSLSADQRRELIKYDFASGFKGKRLCDFEIKEIKTIRKCWLYG